MHSIFKIKRLRFIFLVYWILLAYIIAALIFWFIELNKQNDTMVKYKLEQLDRTAPGYSKSKEEIQAEVRKKRFQYAGEGGTFFLLIVAGAVFVFRALRKQFRISQEQEHFMMAVAHELKTPIAVTKLNLETLQKHKLEASQHTRLMQNTLQEVNRLNDLCNNMLLASQIEGGGYKVTNETIDLAELLAQSMHEFNLRFPARQIEMNFIEDAFVEADRLLLQMVINNLIDNAMKYSPRDSKIYIEVGRDNGTVFFKIKDNGKGIADEEREHIFKKFYRAGNEFTKASKGTGLGLYLSKKIVKEYKGDITVTNNTPHGSIFKVYLPAENS